MNIDIPKTDNALDIYDYGFDKSLIRVEETSKNATIYNSLNDSVNASLITSGSLQSEITMVSGHLQSANYVENTTGWKLDSDGNLDANTGVFRGTITIGTGNNIFKADSNGIYLGNASYASAPFKVSMAGALTATSVNVSGAITTGAGSDIKGEYIDALSVGKLAAGTITSKAITLSFSEGTGDCYIAAGKTDFNHNENGFIMGIDDSDDNKIKFIIGTTTEYLMVNGNTLTNTLKGATYTASVGGTTLLSTSTERQTTSTSFVKLKEINIGRNGDYKLLYELLTYITNGKKIEWSIRKNGSEFASGWSLTDYSTTITISSSVVGDIISLYGKVESGADGPISARYFNLKVDTSLEVFTPYYTTGYN